MDIRQFRKLYNNEQTVLRDINSVTASPAQIVGRQAINSTGEAIADISFAVKFTTMPYFQYGFELQEGEGVVPGKLPTGSAFVSEWKTQERLPNTIFYTGARIYIVTTGFQFQKMICNFSFSGTALTNPS